MILIHLQWMFCTKWWFYKCDIITVGKSDKARVPIEYTVYTDTNCKVLSIFLLMGIWVSRDLYFWASRFGIAAGMVALSLKKKKKNGRPGSPSDFFQTRNYWPAVYSIIMKDDWLTPTFKSFIKYLFIRN